MSLLLDALKKAEKAKEEAQRRAQGEGAGEPRPEAGAAEETRHVRTRDELPSISQSLEIRDEDIRAGEPARPKGLALELEKPEPPPPPSPPPQRPAPQAPQRSSAPAAAEAQAADRATAKRVFEAKFKEPNPRMPFYITMGVLGVFAVGVVIYFWIQLRPAPALVNKNPPPPTGERAVAAAPRAPAATAPLVASAQPAPPVAIPGLPPAGGAPAVAAPASTASGPQAPAPAREPAAAPSQTGANAEAPRGTRQARAAPPAPRATEASTGPIRAQARRPEPKVNPQVASGYQAYQAGDFTAARADYQQALRAEPMNRDALLGLAAVEMQARHYELAEAYYQRLLQADPRDPDAQAGMFALRGQLIDPLVAESRVKTLLASDPQAQVLYFTLGNEYAQQARWGEARQAYLRALAADPENPDFAYNVAVSLDHLGERPLALEYYRRALALAGKRAANFDAVAARERAQQLSR
ncbi:MAG TPA: tetratricopeptide repeat protein [Burkholderiales bacterium]|nr:tetratricopeptide repeat protein [Burkholderiales bacterium]